MPDPRTPTADHVAPAATPTHSDTVTASGAEIVGSASFAFLEPPSVAGDLGRVAGYRVVKLLGEGGMGFVFRAEDESLQRPVALKVMRPEVAAKPNARDRFLREGRAAAAIKSDHVTIIHQVGESNGVAFLAMEFLDGSTLDNWLNQRKGAVPAAAVMKVAKDVLKGLAAAHEKGLVHRDIKPANLWVEQTTGRIKVLDFGLTRAQDGGEKLTADGTVVGTPAYMAPEQAAGKAVDGRADLFSLGVVLHRMLGGRSPFQRDGVLPTLGAVMFDAPPPAASLSAELPPVLAATIDRLLAKDPADRPASAKAVLAELVQAERREREAAASGSQPVVVATPVADPWANLDSTTQHIAVDIPAAPESSEPMTAGKPGGRKRRPWVLVAAMLAFIGGAVVLADIVIKIKNKDGTETEIKVPTDSTVTVTKDGKEVAKVGPDQAKKADPPVPEWTPPKPIPVGASPFDKLDANAIPKDERFDWQPKELVGLIGTHARRHWGPVYAVAVSDDGTKAATVGHDPNVKALPEVIIWETATQKPIRRFHIHDAFAERVQFAEKDSRLYLFGKPSIQLWDIAADPPKPVAIPDPPKYQAKHSGWLLEGGKTYYAQISDGGGDVALFPLDGKGNPDGERRKVGKCVLPQTASCLFAPQANMLIYPAMDTTLRRATVKDAKFVDEEVLSIKLRPNDFPRGLTADGKELVVADDKGLGFWDISVKPPVERRRIPQALLSGEDRVTYSPCGRWLAMRNNAGTALWRLDGAKPKRIALLDPHSAYSGEASFSGDGNTLVVGNREGFVRFWDLRGQEPKELSPFDATSSFAYHSYVRTALDSPNGRLAVSRYDRKWQWWEFTGRKPTPWPDAAALLDNYDGRPTPVSGARWLFCGENYKPSRLLDFAGGQPRLGVDPFAEGCSVLAAPGASSVVAVNGQAPFRLEGWEIGGAKPVKKWSLTPDGYPFDSYWWRERLKISPDGRWFTTPTQRRKDGLAEQVLWRSTGPKPEVYATLPVVNPSLYAAAFSPDGRFLAHSQITNTHEPEVLNITDKEPRKVGQLPKVFGVVHWLAYSPDGRHLAAAGDTGVAVFDAATLKPVWAWTQSPGQVHWLDWAADGRHLVTHNGNKTVYVLRPDLRSRKEVRQAVGDDWVDLLDADPADAWTKQQGRWYSPGGMIANTTTGAVPSGSYVVEVETTLEAGDECLMLWLPVGKQAVHFGFNHYNGKHGGLFRVEGRDVNNPDNPARVDHKPVQVGTKVTVEVRVILNGDTAEITGTTSLFPVIRWKGKIDQLSQNHNPRLSVMSRDTIGLWSHNTRYRIDKLRFKKLDGKAEVIRRVPVDEPPAAPKSDR